MVPKHKLSGSKLILFLSLFFAGIFLLSSMPSEVLHAEELSAEKRNELEHQLRNLEEEASGLDKHLQDVGKEKRTLANETETLNSEVRRRQIEIKKLEVALRRTLAEIQSKSGRIGELSKKIDKNRKALASSLLLLYTYGEESVFSVLLRNWSLSEFFGTMHAVEKVQGNIENALGEFKEERKELAVKKVELQEFEEEQQGLKVLQEVERRLLAQKKAEKDELLRLTKGKEALFQQILSSKKRDIAALKTQLFYLEKTGITAEEALRLADLAAKRAGIRTEFLLALLEVETGRQFEGGVITVGTNLGSGTWKADMNRNQHAAFIKITSELGLDPDKMPVSARPCAKTTRDRIGPGVPCGYGWGGAMGPAQFIPTTWLLFKDKVAELTGHNPPNPWNPEDAFTASAIFLADAGARSKSTVGETRAAKTYLSGRPTCNTSSCNSYARSILSLAGTIGRIL